MQYSRVRLSRIEVSPRSRSRLRRLKTLPAAGRHAAPCAAPSSVSPIPHRSRCPRPRCRLPVIRNPFLFQISDITYADSCGQASSAAPPRRCRRPRCWPPATTSATPNLSRTQPRGDRLARGIAVLVIAPPDAACRRVSRFLSKTLQVAFLTGTGQQGQQGISTCLRKSATLGLHPPGHRATRCPCWRPH